MNNEYNLLTSLLLALAPTKNPDPTKALPSSRLGAAATAAAPTGAKAAPAAAAPAPITPAAAVAPAPTAPIAAVAPAPAAPIAAAAPAPTAVARAASTMMKTGLEWMMVGERNIRRKQVTWTGGFGNTDRIELELTLIFSILLLQSTIFHTTTVLTYSPVFIPLFPAYWLRKVTQYRK
jgi:nucleoid-associated protein YgaU